MSNQQEFLIQNLQKGGILDQLRVELRQQIYQIALEKSDEMQIEKCDIKHLPQHAKICIELFHQFINHHKIQNTKEIFEQETTYNQLPRAQIPKSIAQDSTPSIYQLIGLFKHNNKPQEQPKHSEIQEDISYEEDDDSSIYNPESVHASSSGVDHSVDPTALDQYAYVEPVRYK